MYQGHCGGKRIFKRLAGTQDFASSGCRLLWNGAEPVSRVSKVDDDLQALAILFEDAQVVADDHPIYPQTVETHCAPALTRETRGHASVHSGWCCGLCRYLRVIPQCEGGWEKPLHKRI